MKDKNSECSINLNIMVVGKFNSGVTNLCSRYVENRYIENRIGDRYLELFKTVKTDESIYVLHISGYDYRYFHFHWNRRYSDGIIFVCDMSNRKSFDELEEMINTVKEREKVKKIINMRITL